MSLKFDKITSRSVNGLTREDILRIAQRDRTDMASALSASVKAAGTTGNVSEPVSPGTLHKPHLNRHG